MKRFIGALAGILSSSSVALADTGCGTGGGMMYGMYGGFGSGMMFFSWITYLLIIALIVAAIYWLIKNANKK